MGATAKISFEEFQNLPERQGTIYELDEGQLVMEPSPALRHNLIRQRIAVRLIQYLEAKHLGVVAEEMDFRLATETVRNPDVAVILKEHLAMIDLDASPVDGAPALAVEVVSPSNSAQDMRKKTEQYLRAGSRSVWIVYPTLRFVEVHSSAGVRQVREPEPLKDEAVLPGFSIKLKEIFDVE
jgi:Uma2 family endonuclease